MQYNALFAHDPQLPYDHLHLSRSRLKTLVARRLQTHTHTHTLLTYTCVHYVLVSGFKGCLITYMGLLLPHSHIV